MSGYWGYVEIGKDGRVSTHRVADGNYTRMVVDKLPKDLATVVAALDFIEEDDKFEDELENAATVSDLPMLFKNKIALLDLANKGQLVPGVGKRMGSQYGERNYEIHINKKDQARWAR